MPLNSLEHCICTTTMTNIRPDRDSNLVPPGYKPHSIRMSHRGRPLTGRGPVSDTRWHGGDLGLTLTDMTGTWVWYPLTGRGPALWHCGDLGLTFTDMVGTGFPPRQWVSDPGPRPVRECHPQVPTLSVNVRPRSPLCQWVSVPGPRPVSECQTQVPTLLVSDITRSFRTNEIIFRTNEIIFRTSEIIFRTNEIIFRTNEMLFRTNEIIFRTNEILFRTHEIIFRTNEILFRTNEIIFPYTAICTLPYVCGMNRSRPRGGNCWSPKSVYLTVTMSDKLCWHYDRGKTCSWCHIKAPALCNPIFYFSDMRLVMHRWVTFVHALIAMEIFHYMCGWKSPTRMTSDMDAMLSSHF